MGIKMILDEIFFEHGVSLTKTVWRKRGPDISCKKQEKMVATDIRPKRYIEVSDEKKTS